MKIVIVGAKDRDSADDLRDVSELLDKLEERYQSFTVLTVMSHFGIGKLVKELCGKATPSKLHRFPFVEADIHVYANDLGRDDMVQLYMGRNAMLMELGDIFYHFPHPQRRSVVDELFANRVIPASRPHKSFLPGDDIELTTP
jgi:hypothetical protein